MRYFFSKPDCDKCIWLKEKCDLEKLGVNVLNITTIEGLATLAWFELVGVAETHLPILLVTDTTDPAVEVIEEVVTGAIAIKDFLINVQWKRYKVIEFSDPERFKNQFELEPPPERRRYPRRGREYRRKK